MQRFNILLVGSSANAGQMVQKTVSKVFKKNFLIEIADLAEAETLIDRLNLDLILLDLDGSEVNLNNFVRRFPEQTVWGLSSDSKRLDTTQNRVFTKRNLPITMAAELKVFKKGYHGSASFVERRKVVGARRSTDFKNFFKLVRTN